jgi:hypothetical protein
MTRWLPALLTSTLLLAACGGGGTTTGPTPTGESSFLTGTWNGTVTIHRDGLADTTAPTTWTFTLVPNTAAMTFTTQIVLRDAWLPITAMVTTGLYAPATPGSGIHTIGAYTSPRGCQGQLLSDGTAMADRIEANFQGVDCQQLPATAVFSGSVTLTKSR